MASSTQIPYDRQATESVKVLRLREMAFRGESTLVRRVIIVIISIALRLFFRRIETSGVERVPDAGPLIFVLNHPNGLIDPGLIFCAMPRNVSFLAKATLFEMPVIGSLIRTMEMLPVYRRVDGGEISIQNLNTFQRCREMLAQGQCIALFPEGISHDSTQLLQIKTGAARIALGAASTDNASPVKFSPQTVRILPVGLYYTSKTSFRSEVLIRFGSPFDVESIPLDENSEPPRAEVQKLSTRIEAELRDVTLNTESPAELEDIKKAAQLFSSFYETFNFRHSLTDSFNLLKRLAARLKIIEARPDEEIEQLRERIKRYEDALRKTGITLEMLSISAYDKWYVARHFLLRVVILILLAPLALIGATIHLPAFVLSQLVAWQFRSHGPDAVGGTAKILAAILFMPLTWIIVSILFYLLVGWKAALLALPVTIICGYTSLRTLEEIVDLRGWLKAVLVLLGRRGLFLRLLLERRMLHDEIGRLMYNERR